MSLAGMLQEAITVRKRAAQEAGETFTLTELSRRTGIERTTLGRIVSGELRGDIRSLAVLAEELDLDAGEVLRAAAEWTSSDSAA